ncbi:hypothetical protein B9Z55_003064 [Caenorhabditis nigoni]|uniref:C2H2-type domain-containing protein n=1 Tax=Caenorhabditis nigoni TaxID=1611254 RepID=A0A2G5VNF9_9PELO|nr:hypothetical protein B9Z55_003064 [Caenorhabditis nigoni]
MPSIISCPKCTYTSDRSYNVKRHLKFDHKVSGEDLEKFENLLTASKASKKHGGGAWQCQECRAQVTTKKGLESHMKRKHPKKPENPENISLFCPEIVKSPPRKKVQLERLPSDENIIAKILTVPPKPKVTEGLIECPFENCFSKFRTRFLMALHFCEYHEKDSELLHYAFGTEVEFETWLNQMNQDTCSSWKVRNTVQNGNILTKYYVCRHEGSYVSVAERRDPCESKKKTGSDYCTACLKTEKHEETGEIIVDAFFTHYGHSLEHGLRKLSKDELEYLTGLMRDGFSNVQIIKKCYQLGSTDRLSFTDHNDLNYLRSVHDLIEGKFHEEDLESVRLRVERAWEEDGIRMYTPPDSTGAVIRCSNEQCKQPVHYLCATGNCPSCSAPFEPHVPCESDFDSSEASEDEDPLSSDSESVTPLAGNIE